MDRAASRLELALRAERLAAHAVPPLVRSLVERGRVACEDALDERPHADGVVRGSRANEGVVGDA